MRLMGDRTTYTVTDLASIFEAEISQKVSSVVGKTLEQISTQQSINAISSHLEDFAIALKPRFDDLLSDYGLELVNFSFYNLNIDETEERKKYLDRLIAAAHTGSYDKAVKQELLKDVAVNPAAGGVASAGAGLGMGMAAGNTFAQMAMTAFDNSMPQQPSMPPSGFGGSERFGIGNPQQSKAEQTNPVETLSKMKELLDKGLISQKVYDDKVAEIMKRF